jgi:hypothetical protein
MPAAPRARTTVKKPAFHRHFHHRREDGPARIIATRPSAKARFF